MAQRIAPGSVVGNYKVQGSPKPGGMGEVYKAVDLQIGREVALKVIKELGDAEQRKLLTRSLRQDARAAGKLSHPNIVTIYHIVEEGDIVAVVMEFVDGATLTELLKTRTLEKQTVIGILRQAAVALDYAHGEGIIHRDIKPGNIMIRKGGVVKILDFGVARVLTEASSVETGLLGGTHGYASPEQYRSGSVDGRADQFSLGVISYEMLTGIKPFAADTPLRVMHKVINEAPPPVEQLNPELNPEIGQVLLKALAKQREARFNSCIEFVEALGKGLGLVDDWRPAPTPTPPRPQPPRPPVRRQTGSRARIWLALLGVLVSLGLFGFLVYKGTRTEPSAPPGVVLLPQPPMQATTPTVQPESAVSRAGAISLRVRDAPLPGVVAGKPYSRTLAALGGSPPYQWDVAAGSLPPGLRLDPATGVIHGMPDAAGAFRFTVRVTDAEAATATQTLGLTVNRVAQPPVFLTSELPGGMTGRSYAEAIPISGGSPPYSWAVDAGALPAGLSLDPSKGLILGTPSAPGGFQFTLKVTDSSRLFASQAFTITIGRRAPPPEITSPPNLPVGIARAVYAHVLSIRAGVPPYNWQLAGGSLPPGISLDSAKGVLGGTPAGSGAFQFTLRAADSERSEARQDFMLRIDSPLAVLTTSPLARAIVGRAYSQALSASGGYAPYSWSLAGSLPPGLSLQPARGVLNGTATESGEFRFTVRVTDSAQRVASEQFTLSVAPPPLRTGQIVWQGTLDSGQPVILDGGHASIGSISGGLLPGIPVDIQVLEPSGVEVQTKPGERGLKWTQMVILNNSLQRRSRVVIQWVERR